MDNNVKHWVKLYKEDHLNDKKSIYLQCQIIQEIINQFIIDHTKNRRNTYKCEYLNDLKFRTKKLDQLYIIFTQQFKKDCTYTEKLTNQCLEFLEENSVVLNSKSCRLMLDTQSNVHITRNLIINATEHLKCVQEKLANIYKLSISATHKILIEQCDIYIIDLVTFIESFESVCIKQNEILDASEIIGEKLKELIQCKDKYEKQECKEHVPCKKKCPICFEMCKYEDLDFLKCAHGFCKKCLRSALLHNSCCPSCKIQVDADWIISIIGNVVDLEDPPQDNLLETIED